MDDLTSVQRVERRFRKTCGCCCYVTIHGGSLTKSPDLKLRTGNTQPPEEAQICWTTESPRIQETDSWEGGRRRGSHSRWWQQTSGTQETHPHSTNSPPKEAEILLLLLLLSLSLSRITRSHHWLTRSKQGRRKQDNPNLQI
jgi:hypothetical protein